VLLYDNFSYFPFSHKWVYSLYYVFFQQTKMDWNRQKWIYCVHVKFRFWFFESISIQLKFSNFLNPYEGIKTKRFFFSKKKFFKKKICRPLIHFNLSRGIKRKWFLLFKFKKKVIQVIQFILIHDIGLKWCKCYFFNISIF